MPMAFFMVDVKGHYNVVLGRNWLHECVPSTLHQCVMQWISGDGSSQRGGVRCHG
jgi:hypothetical protein